MSRRVIGLILALVLVLTCTGVALARSASASGATTDTTAAAPGKGHGPIAPSILNSLTAEQKAAVKAKVDTLKSIQQQIQALNKTNARNRVMAIVDEIKQAQAANDSTTVEKLWREMGGLMRPAVGPGQGPMMRGGRGHMGKGAKMTPPDGTNVAPCPKGPRNEVMSAIRDAKDYDSLMTALDKAIAEAQTRLTDAQAGKLPTPPAPSADGSNN